MARIRRQQRRPTNYANCFCWSSSRCLLLCGVFRSITFPSPTPIHIPNPNISPASSISSSSISFILRLPPLRITRHHRHHHHPQWPPSLRDNERSKYPTSPSPNCTSRKKQSVDTFSAHDSRFWTPSFEYKPLEVEVGPHQKIKEKE